VDNHRVATSVTASNAMINSTKGVRLVSTLSEFWACNPVR
jgi:hypothetical protein